MKTNTFLEKSSNVLLALLYVFLTWGLAKDWMEHERISSLLFLIQESFIIVFFLIRSMPKEVSQSPADWFVAIAMTCLPLFMRPGAVMHDMTPLLLLQLTGIAIAILGVLSLNRSLGIVPANRGIKQGGLYRFVRHPIYAGYVVAYMTFLIQNPTVGNIGVMSSFMIFLILRVWAEERLLGRDTEYAAYMTKTRWRILPGVF